MGCGASKKKEEGAITTAPVEKKEEPTSSKTDLRKIFDQFDTDKNGIIDAKELKRAMKALNVEGVTPDDLLKQFKMEGNDTAEITLEEFENNMPANIKEAIIAKINENGLVEGFRPLVNLTLVFNQFDTDDSGALSKMELKRACKALGMTEQTDVVVEDLIDKMDTDKNGEIDLKEWTDNLPKEFKQLMASKLDEKGLIKGFIDDGRHRKGGAAAENKDTEGDVVAEEAVAAAAEEVVASAEEPAPAAEEPLAEEAPAEETAPAAEEPPAEEEAPADE